MKIFDVHIYLGKMHYPFTDIDAEATLRVMDNNGITAGACFATSGIAYDFVEANAWVAEQIAGKSRLFGMPMLNGHYPDESIKEIDKYLPMDNFIGVKIHPSYSRITITNPNFEPIFDKLREYRKPILIHTSSNYWANVNNIAVIAQKYPDMIFIMGHMGRDDWTGAIRVACEFDNLYLDPCCSFPERCKIESAVRKVGAQRMVFGSAMMENHPAYTKGMILDADISDSDRKLIFWDNAQRIFNLPEKIEC